MVLLKKFSKNPDILKPKLRYLMLFSNSCVGRFILGFTKLSLFIGASFTGEFI